MPNKLKPCPLCGGAAEASFMKTDDHTKIIFGWIGCKKCRLFINYRNNLRGIEQAVKAWNRRYKEE